MLLVLLLALPLARGVTVKPFSLARKPEFEFDTLPTAAHVAQLSSRPRSKAKRSLLNAVRRAPSGSSTKDVSSLAGTDGDVEYVTPITIGGQQFQTIVDTGSSDTWVPPLGFQCVNLTDNSPTAESTCAFGPLFNERKSTTFVSVPDKNFNITYGDGEFLVGSVATETVTVAGLTVTKQIIGIANEAAWEGDGVNSGLMGLAYPFLTSVFNGSNPTQDSAANFFEYNPFFFSAIAEKAVQAPLISVALDRGTFAAQENSTDDKNLGFLGFGGVVPVETTSTSTTVPVEGFQVEGSSTPVYLWYTLSVAYAFHGAPALTNTSAILDTGTTLNFLPTPVVVAYNAAFDPPSVLSDEFGIYLVQCKAKVPPFSVVVNGVSFPVAAADQLLPAGLTDDNGNELCVSGTQDGGDPSDPDNIFILGDVFLHNVVATFNLAANSIHLAARGPY